MSCRGKLSVKGVGGVLIMSILCDRTLKYSFLSLEFEANSDLNQRIISQEEFTRPPRYYSIIQNINGNHHGFGLIIVITRYNEN